MRTIEELVQQALVFAPGTTNEPPFGDNIPIDPVILEDEQGIVNPTVGPDASSGHAEPSSPNHTGGRRRCRSSLSEDALEIARLETRQEHLLRYAKESMDHHQLTGVESRNHIRCMAQLDVREQLIELLVIYQKKQVDLAITATRNFTHNSRDEPAQSSLLAPKLKSYVGQLQEWILNNIQQHLQLWKVPDDIIEDATQWAEFSSVIKVKLTQLRSSAKLTIAKMTAEGADINSIMLQLCPRQMVISDEHRERWAFICQCYVEFDGKVQGQTESANKFWEYVGRQLKKVKQNMQASSTSPEQAEQLERSFFMGSLASTEHPTQLEVRWVH
ncbi:hypothetical protein RhiLY_02992 [Ceratobasidium sp. AG-Ba]|nr:hypothetical protein RhiLY_02992 [Ceratobasidium sp. AG-Ba]